MAEVSSTRLKASVRDYGCRYRLPHDYVLVADTKRAKYERCQICNHREVFPKWSKGRMDNRAYLAAHARNFAQPVGRTKRLYMKIHHADQTVISL